VTQLVFVFFCPGYLRRLLSHGKDTTLAAMFRRGVRTFATSALRLAEPSPHLLAVSRAQGISNGLTEGTAPFL
jgi:hypothetical protein